MADAMGVDTAATRASSLRLRDAGTRMIDSVRRLEGQLGAIGVCWGSSDEVAVAFEKSYTPARNNIVKGANDVGQLLNGLSDQVARAMNGYEQTEDAAVRAASAG